MELGLEQVGPWRIARKHLLFVILFSLSIIAFGIIILVTHVFDNEESEEEGEENENENENEENEEEEGGKRWGSFRQKFSSGDWVVVAIMILAGLMSVGATMICFMVRKDTPRRLNSSHGNASVYSVKFNNGNSKVPIPDQTSAPQPLPLWQGHVQLPSRTSNSQVPAGLNQQSQNKPIQITVSNLPGAPKLKNTSASSPSAPQIEGESPPPYSPASE